MKLGRRSELMSLHGARIATMGALVENGMEMLRDEK